MKLFYITRTMIPSNSAQSVQIAAMCEVFFKYVENFWLISSQNAENQNMSRAYHWKKVNLVTPFRYLEFVLKIFFLVLKEQPTHIFTRDIAVAYLFSFWKIKIVYEAHKEPRTKTARWIMRRLEKKQNFLLVTISKALKEYYIREYFFNSEKISDCHDGVFLEEYEKVRHVDKKTLRETLSLPSDKIIVMHTGSLYAGRGAELFETIVKNFQEIYFVQVGGLKEDITFWQNYYQDYPNIVFIEHQTNQRLIKYQMSADVLFYPLTYQTSTWWCCSPMKVFEYMATGVPILGSNIGSIAEVLNDENSFIFDPDNAETIVKQMKFIQQNPNVALQRASKAYENIQLSYRWEVRAQKILEFMK